MNNDNMAKDISAYNFFQRLVNLSFIDEIWLFGSRARADNTDRADIDLAIISQNASDDDWAKVMDIIEDADTLLKIDCIRFNSVPKIDDLYRNIINDKKVLYVKK